MACLGSQTIFLCWGSFFSMGKIPVHECKVAHTVGRSVLPSKLRGSYILYSCTAKDVTRFVWTFGWAFGVKLGEIFSVFLFATPKWEVVTLFRFTWHPNFQVRYSSTMLYIYNMHEFARMRVPGNITILTFLADRFALTAGSHL